MSRWGARRRGLRMWICTGWWAGAGRRAGRRRACRGGAGLGGRRPGGGCSMGWGGAWGGRGRGWGGVGGVGVGGGGGGELARSAQASGYGSLGFVLPRLGVYYVGVSGQPNGGYNPAVAASGVGAAAAGDYRLSLTLQAAPPDFG